MLEENPFYTVDFVENEDVDTSLKTEDIANDNPTGIYTQEQNEAVSSQPNIEENQENLQRENVQEPEKKEEVKSTGVSTYTEVPSITNETIECNTNLISTADKFNLWLVFAFFVWVLNSFKKRKFTRLIEKTTNIILKYASLINILLLVIAFTIFLYPKFFGTGISGKLDLFTMLEFATIISINAITLTFLSFRFLRNKKIIFKKAKTFSGINFLERSLLTFSTTSLLFFFFTESQIALGLLYFFIILSSLFFFIDKKDEQIAEYNNFYLILTSIQFAIIGGLSGLYIIMLIGTLLTGYYYPIIKTILKTKGE